MQLELKRIQTELGTTFVYVTHDQEEALTMSDRIAVMNGGDIEQIGDLKEIYERPQTPFVADFVGSLNASTSASTRSRTGSRSCASASANDSSSRSGRGSEMGDELRVAVRPERVRIEPTNGRAPEGGRHRGHRGRARLSRRADAVPVETSAAGRLVSHRMDDEVAAALGPGKHVTLTWPAEHAYVLAGAVSSEA